MTDGKHYKVIYHGNCFDGFTSAWAMRKGLLETGNTCECIPAVYGETKDDLVLKGDRVFIVDFSYPRAVLERMKAEAEYLQVLDHHATAEEDLKGLDYALFDMDRSGAGMAWDWNYNRESRPSLISYVEDRDLWRFALPQSKAVNAYISAQIMSFDRWDELAEMSVKDMAQAGSGVLDFVNRYVNDMKKEAQIKTFAGYPNIPVVNAPYINTSELVGALAEDVLFAVGWFQCHNGKIKYSLRSTGDFNVSELAKQFGGGGHPKAAGFSSEPDNKPFD